jgi:hypothetical protein
VNLNEYKKDWSIIKERICIPRKALRKIVGDGNGRVRTGQERSRRHLARLAGDLAPYIKHWMIYWIKYQCKGLLLTVIKQRREDEGEERE